MDDNAIDISLDILNLVFGYQLQNGKDTLSRADEGVLSFLSTVYKYVKQRSPVRMCVPAFPFKSPNTRDKVLGLLPDKAEEIALTHLNTLCESIRDIYKPGAKLVIISDGLVYNGKRFFSEKTRDYLRYVLIKSASRSSRSIEH
jgi:pyoverdine/dityrosine biosynthesis protein Dit1